MVTPAPVHRISVVLSRTPLVLLASVWRVAALPIAELGVAAFMVAGLTLAAAGGIAPWAVLLVCLFGAFLRTVDLESWALIMPNGLVGRGEAAFGPRGGRLAAAVGLVERLLAATLALVLVGRHSAVILAALAPAPFPSGAVDDLATLGAVVVLAVLWLRARVGRGISRDTVVAAVWTGAASLALVSAAAAVAAFRHASPADLIPLTEALAGSGPGGGITTLLTALAFALPAIGSGSAVAAAAHEFPAPRLPSLLRMSTLVVLVGLAMIAVPTFALSRLPAESALRWTDTPVLGLAIEMSAAPWLQGVASFAIVCAAFLLLVPAAHRALADAEQGVRRLSARQSLPTALAALHPRFGTPAKSVDLIAIVTMAIALVSGSRVAWLGGAYAFAVGFRALFKVAAILRLRWLRAEPAPFVAPFNLPIGSRRLPVGLLSAGLLLIATLGALLGTGGLSVVATLFAIVCLTMLFAPRASDGATAIPLDPVPLLSPSDVYPGPIDARPGNILVPVRNPRALTPITAALRGATDRDVVVMTVRLLGVDVDEESAGDPQPTPAEADLLARASALAERHGRPIRLLIVPALNPIDAITATALRLGSSEIYVGESSTLAADAQARMLGEAWERSPEAVGHTIRLVIHHPSGRADAFHIGAHLPALTPGDLDLIHRLWLDASKAVGPHIHHHDVVRAALTQMEQQMSGPAREDALATIRRTARPADELATIIKARDYPRLRDLVRNRDAADMVTLLSELSLEDQVVFFRVLPRKDAAAVFEYLSADAQEALLKTMAHEDVATLLGHMAPDDRTMFLEELPAAATRQLLALLTPAERSVALTLLGYPEGSIGRLMTPNYVAVREDWTVREVLDHIRAHGEDRETLDVIYVIDHAGRLIDDIRIRELLLTALDTRISTLMDRRVVALKATENQQTAVAEFRKYDRVALPVTDTAGVLIGIVTIDDILDVAEAAATSEIQRIGGSAALEEPYMEISMRRMIRKRAGWLTALFLGEMLTATAMGFFEAEIAKAVVLALFVPLIISSGGNSGSQASTLVIRALALGEVGLPDWWRVMRRELLAGASLGAILGSIGFLRITLWSTFSTVYGPHWLLVAATVALALVGIVLWGTLVGSLLPFGLRRLGFDPATSSAPFVATLVDVTGLLIYFGVAVVILRGTLL